MLRVRNDCKCVFWGYQISPKRSRKEGEAVQFFDQLRLITFFQSSSGYLHSFVLSDMNCNAELGINFFRQFIKGAGRVGGCLGVALDGMVVINRGTGFWEVGHTPLPNFSCSTPLGILKWFINKCWTEFKFYPVITAVALSCKLLSIN